jgi:hypothetical protein
MTVKIPGGLAGGWEMAGTSSKSRVSPAENGRLVLYGFVTVALLVDYWQRDLNNNNE